MGEGGPLARVEWLERAFDDIEQRRLVPIPVGEQVMGLTQRMQPGEERLLLASGDVT